MFVPISAVRTTMLQKSGQMSVSPFLARRYESVLNFTNPKPVNQKGGAHGIDGVNLGCYL